MTKKYNQDFEKSAKDWMCDNYYINNDIKVKYRNIFHIEIVISTLNQIKKFLSYFTG